MRAVASGSWRGQRPSLEGYPRGKAAHAPLGRRSRGLGLGLPSLFDRATLERLVSEHESGEIDHADRLWLLLNLELWQRVFLDGHEAKELSACA